MSSIEQLLQRHNTTAFHNFELVPDESRITERLEEVERIIDAVYYDDAPLVADVDVNLVVHGHTNLTACASLSASGLADNVSSSASASILRLAMRRVPLAR